MVLIVNTFNTLTYAERPNYVYDWEDLLTEEEETNIENYCLQVDSNTTVEIVVITLKSFNDPVKVDGIDDARVYYFNDYPLDGVKGIGKIGEDNGILIVLSMNEGYWGIEIGYGLEGDLTDSESGRIGRDILVKYLKDKNYEMAFFETVKAIAIEVGYGNNEVPQDQIEDIFDSIPMIVWIIIIIVIVLILLIFVDVGEGSFRGSYGGSGSSSSGGFGGGGSGGGGTSGGVG